MIVLDTNVVSELARERPDPAVNAWLNSQTDQDLFLCAPVLAELRYGVELLPAGRRRNLLEHAIQQVETVGFLERILPFDREAAHEFGRIVAKRNRVGRPMSAMDGMIAAIAIVHSAAIATRDIEGFSDLGIDVINPFEAMG